MVPGALAMVPTYCDADQSKNGPESPAPYYTGWYNSDTPLDGTDNETLASVKLIDAGVCDSPIRTECRVRISQITSGAAGQDLSQDCGNASSGLVCEDAEQAPGEECFDYEIRFWCPPATDALPAPTLHWEWNGRTSASDRAPTDCTGRKKITSTIYSSSAKGPDGVLDNVTRSSLILNEAHNASRHVCVTRNDRTAMVDLGNFAGLCVTEPSCCTSGLTFSLWMNIISEPTAITTIITSGGHKLKKRGFFLRTKQGELLRVEVNFDGKRLWTPKFEEVPVTYGNWAHYTITWNTNERIFFINGVNVFDDNEIPGSLSGQESGYESLTAFGVLYQVFDPERIPNMMLSDLKIFYTEFNESQVEKLYQEEVGSLSVSSEDNVRILYNRQVSDPSDPNLLVECLARGPSQNNEPTINWYILDEDGLTWLALNQSAFNYTRYDSSVSNNYRTRSAVQLIQYTRNQSIVCEAVDKSTLAAQSEGVTATGYSYSWTQWFSTDNPNGTGDIESIISLHQETCEEPTDIECRAKYTQVPANATMQLLAVACTLEGGLACVNSQQSSGDNFTCFDYEVRLLCPQEPLYWTEWFDVDQDESDGQNEEFSTHLQLSNTTLCSAPLFAQCREVGSKVIWTPTANRLSYPYVCTTDGLVCLTAENSGCHDYEVRYACPYNEVKSSGEYWDLSGRTSVDGPDPGDCSTHTTNMVYSNTGRASTSNPGLSYTDAPAQMSQKCAVKTSGTAGIDLGDFSGECLSKIGWCRDGMTVSMWLRQFTDASGGDVVLFGSGGERISGDAYGYDASNGFIFSQMSTQNYVVNFRSDNLVRTIPEFSAELSNGEWHHVTLTFDDVTGGNVYIDGELKGSTDAPVEEFNGQDSLSNFILGSSNQDTNFADAAYSDVRFFYTTLSGDEVASLYYCGVTTMEPEVLSITRISGYCDADLVLTCDVKGYPITDIVWSRTQSITPPMTVEVLSDGSDDIEITNQRSACVTTSSLRVTGFALWPLANGTTFGASLSASVDEYDVMTEIPMAGSLVSTLIINSTDSSRFDGTYTCTAACGYQQVSNSTNVQYVDAFNLTHIMGYYDDTLLFYWMECALSFVGPTPHVVWVKPNGGEVVDGDGDYNLTLTVTNQSLVAGLTIDSTNYALYDGTYTCKVVSGYRKKYYDVTVEYVHTLPKPSVNGHYNFTHLFYWMECTLTFTGVQPTVVWTTPEGANVTTSAGDYDLTLDMKSDSIVSVLKIQSTNYSLCDGTYTCKAVRGLQTVESNVTVEYAYTGDLFINVTQGFTLGDDVRVTCSALDGESVSDITWSKMNDQSHFTPVTQNDIIKVTEVRGQGEFTSYLHISLFSRLDEGTYKCAVNGGSNARRITVTAPADLCQSLLQLQALQAD
ncbi:uncharacterized protein [Diadema setosum]|uniref:uncharacterized protein n=1 Tax=Diadema setosum TaxID=31175 RepID=UPI003B3B489F